MGPRQPEGSQDNSDHQSGGGGQSEGDHQGWGGGPQITDTVQAMPSKEPHGWGTRGQVSHNSAEKTKQRRQLLTLQNRRNVQHLGHPQLAFTESQSSLNPEC